MHYVYVIMSLRDRKCYTGRTDDLRRRMSEHLSKKVHTTARFGEIKLVFYEAFLVKADAIRRELYLKTSKGKSTLRMMLRDSLQ